MPPDGRAEIGRKIEGLVHGLNELVTDYLNMLSLQDRAAAEEKVRTTIRVHPVLARVLHFSPLPNPQKEPHSAP